jgi:hypothetical protein
MNAEQRVELTKKILTTVIREKAADSPDACVSLCQALIVLIVSATADAGGAREGVEIACQHLRRSFENFVRSGQFATVGDRARGVEETLQ